MENKSLQIVLRNHLAMLTPILFGLPIYLATIYYLRNDYLAALGLGLIYIVQLLAVLYIHLTYYFYNKNIKIIIQNGFIYCINKYKNKEYKISNIDHIKIYGDEGIFSGFYFSFFPFISYHYVFIKMKDGSKLYLTSLLDPKIFKVEEIFDKSKIQYESTKFAIIDTSE
jgi:hypothetical protein